MKKLSQMMGGMFFPFFFFNPAQPWNFSGFKIFEKEEEEAQKPVERRSYKVGDCVYSFNDLISNGRETFKIKIEGIKGNNYQLSYQSEQSQADGIVFEDSIGSIEADKDLVKTACAEEAE